MAARLVALRSPSPLWTPFLPFSAGPGAGVLCFIKRPRCLRALTAARFRRWQRGALPRHFSGLLPRVHRGRGGEGVRRARCRPHASPTSRPSSARTGSPAALPRRCGRGSPLRPSPSWPQRGAWTGRSSGGTTPSGSRSTASELDAGDELGEAHRERISGKKTCSRCSAAGRSTVPTTSLYCRRKWKRTDLALALDTTTAGSSTRRRSRKRNLGPNCLEGGSSSSCPGMARAVSLRERWKKRRARAWHRC